MTPQAQRIAIAEACGLKIIGPDHPRYSQYTLQYSSPGWRLASYPGPGLKGCGPSQVTTKEQCEKWIERDKDYRPGQTMEEAELIEQVPRYPSDLNAMRSVLETLTNDQWERYEADLWNIVAPGEIRQRAMPIRLRRALLCSTSEQQAEAFLRTLGKWG